MLTQSLPRGFVLRRPIMDDIELVLQLIQTCEIEREGCSETTLDGLRVWWHMPNFTLATDAWIVLSPEGQIVGLAIIRADEHARIYVGGEVHPDYRGRGIGTHLLQLNEERARQHLAEAAQDVRVAMLSWVAEKSNLAQQLLERHGFEKIRSSWRMKTELDEAPPVPNWAEGITVRTPADNMDMFHAIYEADEEAFEDHWGHMPTTFEVWESWTRKRESFDPALLWLAVDSNEMGGGSLCAGEKERGGWVHSLAVRRQWRRRGIGEALLHHSFGEFYKRGIHNVSLGVDAQSLTGATRLYERVGMHIDHRSYTYEKELRVGRELSTQTVEA